LTVRAFNAQGGRGHATVNVEATEFADRDGDGVPDPDDRRPDDPGPPEGDGAPEPEPGAGDRDGDGSPDPDDRCPEDEGLPEHDGCPPPDGDEPPPPGPIHFIGRAFLGPFHVLPNVEFEALEFEAFDDYDEVYCYASLAGGDVERYGPFEPLGERRWDIADYLGGENSRRLYVPYDEFLEVQVECGADDIFLGPRGGWGTPWDLGSLTRRHYRADWHGHDITVESDPGPEGHHFQVKYRICEGPCEEAALPPPYIWRWRIGSEEWLIWTWTGDYGSIEGFRVYVNDTQQHIAGNDTNIVSVEDYAPSCGERHEFQVTAYAGDRESPPSNIEVWEGETCPRTVLVTFDTLSTHELCCEASPVGPIMGSLGANGEWLNFDAANVDWWGWVVGLDLESHHQYSIEEEILEVIAGMEASCRTEPFCPDFDAPRRNYEWVPLDAGEDLTFSVEIYDVDRVLTSWGWWEELETACEAHSPPIPADEIITGRYTAFGDRCNLTVEIEVMETRY
jgi:hypothetical protein